MPKTLQDRKYCSITEAAGRIGVTPTSVYRWAWSGDLVTVKIGGRRLVPLDAIEPNLDRGRKGSRECN